MTAVMAAPRARAVAARELWADALEAALWFVAAAAIALFIVSGGLLTTSAQDYVYAAGRVAGIVAAVFVMNQVLLISRVPAIERVLGHDRAAAIHTRMGKAAFMLMLVHVALILIMSARYDGLSLWSQTAAFWDLGWFMVAAQVGFGFFTIVVATSLLIVRRRWRYESWHAVHLLVYAAIALVVPHQFIHGTTFRGNGAAWWFWIALYAVTFGAWVTYRVARPLWMASRHMLRVAEVTPHSDGSTSVVVTGRALDRMGARPGQFFLWRFLARGYWSQAHPFSLSRAPRPHSLRITVNASGDHGASLAHLPVGTRVFAEGPLGVFTGVSRARNGVVFVAAGIGVTPVRAMLEDVSGEPCDVIVRARSAAEAPLIDEIRALADGRAVLHEIYGPRGDGWTSQSHRSRLDELVPDVAERDVFICGPVDWADAVVAEARAAGVPASAVHRERFGW